MVNIPLFLGGAER